MSSEAATDGEDEPRPKRTLSGASKPVRDRWHRLRMRRWGWEVGRAIARKRIWWRERKPTKQLERTFVTIKELTIKSERSRVKSIHVLNKAAFYLLMAARDVQAAKLDALTHPDEWTRRLHARVVLLTVYEWDMDGVSGRALMKALDTMKVPPDVQEEMTQALRQIRKVRERVIRDYKRLRDTTIAHRDPDVMAQYRAVRDFDTNQLYSLLAEFFRAVDQFVVAHTKVYQTMNVLAAVLSDWAAWEKSGGSKPSE